MKINEDSFKKRPLGQYQDAPTFTLQGPRIRRLRYYFKSTVLKPVIPKDSCKSSSLTIFNLLTKKVNPTKLFFLLTHLQQMAYDF